MENCTKNDLKLVEKAKKVLQKNYKSDSIKHTVGCALTTKSGKEYKPDAGRDYSKGRRFIGIDAIGIWG